MKSKAKKRYSKSHLRSNRQRVGILLMFLTAVVFVIFVCRFSYIAHGKAYSVNLDAKLNQQVTHTKVIPAKRGAILDKSGTVIAESGNTYKVYALLKHQYPDDKRKVVRNKQKTAEILSRYLQMSSDEVLQRLNPQLKTTSQVEFGASGASLSLDTKGRLQAEKLPGIMFSTSSSRLYPNGTFASHVIGMVNVNNDASTSLTKVTGTMGLEKWFNGLLSGRNGQKTEKTDFFGYQLNGTKVKDRPVRNGGTVYTTLDTNLQSYLESMLNNVQDRFAPKELTATVMSAKTGAILATSERPTFDPVSQTGLSKWNSALTQDVYEPGSIMKIVTLASAIDSGTYRPNEYYQSGNIKIGGGTIYDWQRSGWGTIPLSQAFPRSSNVGMVNIEQDMGAATWQKYLHRFGFGTKTGITLPDESSGSIAFNGKLNQVSTAFGQAINVTVVQMLRAMTAVSNNGEMVQPRIVSKTVSGDGKVTNYGTKKLGRVIKKSSAEGVRAEMRQVVNATYGTGRVYKINGVDLGVKTGTAQVAGTHGYLTGSNNYTFSVAGMVPISNPKYVVYITMKQPQRMTEDPEKILNSIFTPLVKRTLALEGAQGVAVTPAEMPSVIGTNTVSAQQQLQKAGYKVTVVGSGNQIVQQQPVVKQQVLPGSRVILLTNGAMTMPSVLGWGKSDVLKLAQITGVSFTLRGDGFASAQSLKQGALISGDGGTITFSEQ
ncbi:penicillin-binding transpeptidase domain-containing protein [Lacticaseibacillus zhaodongensis]|uniref:penicillin-binding transpeptidase domain-containing protein n=1 Tax=Lacticaseibacillus zhaodongensis TaxID=2668065 RepID=UPI0012D334B7|nr:penicillin-binding transpeptidase domain-containing protein [Lacticaseibacillus zhaodongensis]